jgi:deoxyribodipyrimidine photolyase
MRTCIVWFRRDLRTHDHAAQAAITQPQRGFIQHHAGRDAGRRARAHAVEAVEGGEERRLIHR